MFFLLFYIHLVFSNNYRHYFQHHTNYTSVVVFVNRFSLLVHCFLYIMYRLYNSTIVGELQLTSDGWVEEEGRELHSGNRWRPNRKLTTVWRLHWDRKKFVKNVILNKYLLMGWSGRDIYRCFNGIPIPTVNFHRNVIFLIFFLIVYTYTVGEEMVGKNQTLHKNPVFKS